MSYSFNVRAATRDEIKTKIAAEFDKVVQIQSIHSVDRRQAEAATVAFLDVLLEASPTQDYIVSVHGSVSWSNVQDISSANVGVTASVVSKTSP